MRVPKQDDDQQLSLLAKIAEDAACRVALVKSLNASATGLNTKKHNRLISLLCKMASEGFSDGNVTDARVVKLAEACGKSRSTIFRILTDAESLGIITSVKRFGTIGQQISTRRQIEWHRVKELAKLSRQHLPGRLPSVSSPPVGDTPPCQMTRGSVRCDAPVSSDTPCITDNPDRKENHLKSGGLDRKNLGSVRNVTESTIRESAGRLFERLRYTGDEGQTLWLAAAAVHLGILPEASVSSAAMLTREAGKGPGYFRKVLADKSQLSLDELKRLLQGFRVSPKLPGSPPASIRRSPQFIAASPFQRPPNAGADRFSDDAVNRRRNELDDQLRALKASAG